VSLAPPRFVGTESDVVIDGKLEEPVWDRASMLTGFSEYLPVDGRAADDSTQVLIWYSSTAIYFGIRAFAPPNRVHATLANRDNITADDNVQIFLDTFNDHRQAAVFAVNPLGVQSDGTLTEGSQKRSTGVSGSTSAQSVRDTVDLSADFVYQSKGRLTDYGYEVEIRIPFKTLRYQSVPVQNWGINVVREVQYNGHEDTWTPATRANASFLAQSGQITGLTELSRGVVLDIIPELTSKISGTPTAPLVPSSAWSYDASRPQLGGNLRWGITNNLTLAGTVKPDFSQVEADIQQITYDPRQLSFYPERRPFFLDGIEYLQAPNTLIYTRRIISPVSAVKLAGKVSGTNVGLLSAVDDQQYSSTGTNNPIFNVLRVRRDLGRSSTLGFVYTDKIDGSDYNRTAGVDSRVVFGKIYSLAFQGAASATRTGGVTSRGPLWEGAFDRNGRTVALHWITTGIHPDFNPAAGFVSRGAIVHSGFANIFTLYGKPGSFLQSWAHNLTLDYTWNYDHFVHHQIPEKNWFHNSSTFTFRGGWRLGAQLFLESYRYDSTIYVNYRIERHRAGLPVDTVTYGAGATSLPNFDLGVNIATPQFKTFDGTLSVLTGVPDDNFYEWSGAYIAIITATANWRPTDQLRINARYTHQEYWRKDDRSIVAIRRIPRVKVEYQLARPLFLRAVAQYDAQHQDSLRDDSRTNFPVLYYSPGTNSYSRALNTSANNFRIDWLLSYTPVPGTVLFLGYGSSLTETDAFTFRDLHRTVDGFFLKLTYLFRM
jgi:hypothetical protein